MHARLCRHTLAQVMLTNRGVLSCLPCAISLALTGDGSLYKTRRAIDYQRLSSTYQPRLFTAEEWLKKQNLSSSLAEEGGSPALVKAANLRTQNLWVSGFPRATSIVATQIATIPERWTIKGATDPEEATHQASKAKVVTAIQSVLQRYGYREDQISLPEDRVFREQSGRYKGTYTAKPIVQPDLAAFGVLLAAEKGDLEFSTSDFYIHDPIPKSLSKDFVVRVKARMEREAADRGPEGGEYGRKETLAETVSQYIKGWALQLHDAYAKHLEQQDGQQPAELRDRIQAAVALYHEQEQLNKDAWIAAWVEQRQQAAQEGGEGIVAAPAGGQGGAALAGGEEVLTAAQAAWEQRVQDATVALSQAIASQFYQELAMSHPVLILIEGMVREAGWGSKAGEVNLELRHPVHVQLMEKGETLTLLNPLDRSQLTLEPIIVDCSPLLLHSVISSPIPTRAVLKNPQHMLHLTKMKIGGRFQNTANLVLDGAIRLSRTRELGSPALRRDRS